LIGIIQTVNNIVTSDNYSLVEYKRPFNWYKKTNYKTKYFSYHCICVPNVSLAWTMHIWHQ